MRVIECNECGEALSGATDEELTQRLRTHLADEHDEDIDAEDARELVEDKAYEATDS
jgi:predicted small metal-binding protein